MQIHASIEANVKKKARLIMMPHNAGKVPIRSSWKVWRVHIGDILSTEVYYIDNGRGEYF